MTRLFTFSNEKFQSKELDRDNFHLFTLIHRMIESSLTRIKLATHQIESLHRFSFMLKANTSPMVDVLIADVQQLLDESRNLGNNLGTVDNFQVIHETDTQICSQGTG